MSGQTLARLGVRRALARSTALTAVGVIMLTAAQAQNFILNPSFEANGGDGSTVASPWNFTNGSQVGTTAGDAHSGAAYARLNYVLGNNNATGTLSQSVVTAQGGMYAFSFYYGTFGAGSAAVYNGRNEPWVLSSVDCIERINRRRRV